MRRITTSLLLPLAVIVFVIALPVVIPIVAVLHRRDRRRMQAVAESTRCVQCGVTLGLASLRQADMKWADQFAALQRDRPTIRFRLVRRLWALCTACGAEYDYDEGALVFHHVATSGVN